MNWSMWLNLTGCTVNVVLSVLTIYRMRVVRKEFDAVVVGRDAIIQSLLPAVAVCKTLADDPHTSEAWRAFAKAAIPDSVTVTTVPVASSGRVH